MKYRTDVEVPEFTDRQRALLEAWDASNSPAVDEAFTAQLCAAYHRDQVRSRQAADAHDDEICVAMAAEAFHVDAAEDPWDQPGRPVVVPVDLPAHRRITTRRSSLGIALAAASIAIALGVQFASLRNLEVDQPATSGRIHRDVQEANQIIPMKRPPMTPPAKQPQTPASHNAAVSPSHLGSETPALVELEIRVSPEHATVSIDGKDVDGNPFSGRYVSDGFVHHIRASAPGYIARSQAVVFDANVTLDLSLDRVESPQPAAPPARRAVREVRARPSAAASAADPQRTEPTGPAEPARATEPPLLLPAAAAEPNAAARPDVVRAGGKTPPRAIDPNNPYLQ
jgi:hypothetical protein